MAEIIHEKALVLEVQSAVGEYGEGEDFFDLSGSGLKQEQTLKVEILSGDNAGEVVTIKNDLYSNPYDIKVEKGDKVSLYAEVSDGSGAGAGTVDNQEYFIQDYWHTDGLILWGAIFLGLVLLIGRKAGLKAILSLGGSLVLIFLVLLPLIVKGYNPLLFTILVAAAIILITHLIITGIGKKSWAAMIGTFGGVVVAGILVKLVSSSAQITAMGTEDSRILAVNNPLLNFQGILFAGILLGALGAVMDVGISIASGLSEIKEHKPKISRKALVKSGMAIGRDILGTMMNTLIFAYIGSALMSVVLFYILKTDVVELFNHGFIAEEAVRSLVGATGLLATIPLTAFVSGLLMGKSK